jgi:hypothetical protein
MEVSFEEPQAAGLIDGLDCVVLRNPEQSRQTQSIVAIIATQES